MFDEAASLASSFIKKFITHEYVIDGFVEKSEVEDMLESAGMVLVQSLKALGRSLEILDELKLLYKDIAAIPVHVLHTGACIQISEKHSSGVQELLEEFLRKWRYVKDGYYIRSDSGSSDINKYDNGLQFTLKMDKYLEVVELYVTFLGTVKNDIDLAISWVGEASLPEEKQQELSRRLHSINSSKVTTSFQESLAGDHTTNSFSMQSDREQNGSPGDIQARRDAILKLSGKKAQCFWWFRSITLRFGNNRFDISNGNMFLTCLALIIYYIMRRKQISLKRFIEKQALNVKKALVDVWKLAFSHQVNPLAAVQPLPTSGQGRR